MKRHSFAMFAFAKGKNMMREKKNNNHERFVCLSVHVRWIRWLARWLTWIAFSDWVCVLFSLIRWISFLRVSMSAPRLLCNHTVSISWRVNARHHVLSSLHTHTHRSLSIYLFAYFTQAKTQTSKWSNIKTSSKCSATIQPNVNGELKYLMSEAKKEKNMSAFDRYFVWKLFLMLFLLGIANKNNEHSSTSQH